MTLRGFLRKQAASWARRRQGEDRPPIELDTRRVYILPTGVGLGFAAMLLVMLIAGINYANSLALFLTFLLAGFGLVTMHQCHRNLARTSIVSAATLPTFARTPGTLRVALKSDARFPRFGIEIDVEGGPARQCHLQPHGEAELSVAVPAPKRGVVRIDRFRVSSTFPFGLFRAWSWVHMPLELIVYPRAHGTLPMPADRGIRNGTHSQGLSGSDEWLSLRPFRDGDSPRQVAWKAYARGMPLLVKEYSSMSAELRIFDMSQVKLADTEAKLEQLARWIVDAEARGERYGLVVPTRRLDPDSGPEHRHRCLTQLALFGQEASNDAG